MIRKLMVAVAVLGLAGSGAVAQEADAVADRTKWSLVQRHSRHGNVKYSGETKDDGASRGSWLRS